MGFSSPNEWSEIQELQCFCRNSGPFKSHLGLSSPGRAFISTRGRRRTARLCTGWAWGIVNGVRELCHHRVRRDEALGVTRTLLSSFPRLGCPREGMPSAWKGKPLFLQAWCCFWNLRLQNWWGMGETPFACVSQPISTTLSPCARITRPGTSQFRDGRQSEFMAARLQLR